MEFHLEPLVDQQPNPDPCEEAWVELYPIKGIPYNHPADAWSKRDAFQQGWDAAMKHSEAEIQNLKHLLEVAIAAQDRREF